MLTPEDRERIALAIEAKAKGEWEGFQDGLMYAAAFVRALPTEPPWVRVEDRLPEPEVDVLTFEPTECRLVARFIIRYGRFATEDGQLFDATHWMPLPEPPEPAPCPSTPSE